MEWNIGFVRCSTWPSATALRCLLLLNTRLLYLKQHLAPTRTSKGKSGQFQVVSQSAVSNCAHYRATSSIDVPQKKIKFTWNPSFQCLKLLSAPCLITEKGDDPTERLWFVWEKEIWINFALELCWLIYWTSKRRMGREEVEEGNLSRGLDWKSSGGTLVPL